MAASVEGSPLDSNDFMSGVSIYFVQPGSRIASAMRQLRVLTGYFTRCVMSMEVKPSHPVMFLLEEMATLRRMPVIE